MSDVVHVVQLYMLQMKRTIINMLNNKLKLVISSFWQVFDFIMPFVYWMFVISII